MKNEQILITVKDYEPYIGSQAVERIYKKAYGFQIPNVDMPKSREEVGRQWTSKGPDKPERLK